MAATISMVATSRPGRLCTAAARLTTSARTLRHRSDTHRRALGELGGAWTGRAASAALHCGQRHVRRQGDLADRLDATQSALASAGTDLSALRAEIQNVAAQATALGGVVAGDGTVTGVDEQMTPTLAAAYTATLKTLLEQFAAVDRLTADTVLLAFDTPLRDAPPPLREPLAPPAGATDTEVNRWWDNLTAAEQGRMIVDRPDWIGNLDGVPATARDAANRNRLGPLRTAPQLTTEQRDTIAEIDRALSAADRRLLVLDLDGAHPKVALAVGDVDTADHVSVHVPGAGATPWRNPDPARGNDLPTYLRQAAWLKADAEQVLAQARVDESVATVVWMAYEPPSNVMQAASPHYADDNAPALASFVNGIDSARDDDPHLTVLGHSYGSTLASEALQRGTAADDAVFLGSPGLETNPWQFYDDVTPADLHLSEGHVFVEQARGDVVGGLGRFGASWPARLPGFVELSAEAADTPLGHRVASWGHSEYHERGSTALYNQAVVVAGLGRDARFVREGG